FSKWFERYIGYGFRESIDYSTTHKKVRVQIEGKREVSREVEDYDLSVDMAKQICMLQRTDKGMELRQYFIDLEKAWNTPEQIFARALKMADKTIERLKENNAILLKDNQRMKPKEEFFDAVAGSKDAIEIGKVAKVLNYPGVGRNKLFEILRDNGVLMKDNVPYQKYIDNGCFRTVEQKYHTPDGETRINIKTLVYQKGVEHIRKILKSA
ncbi:MAG: phage antirepressor KilAC domain-containing protein, partial [Bacillota bacterium]|nr:phage antirepressor KilAC domain-containing protein [Bacillota bacterium]